jgi:hypothetical protein
MGHKWVPACKTPTPTERSNALAPSTHAAVALWVAHNHCHTIMMPMGATTVARCLCGYMHCSMERRPAACRRVCAARGSTTSGWHQPCHLRARCMCVGSKLPVAAGPGEGSTGSITTAMVPTYVSQAHVLAAAAAHHWAVGCSLPPPPPPRGCASVNVRAGWRLIAAVWCATQLAVPNFGRYIMMQQPALAGLRHFGMAILDACTRLVSHGKHRD